jgi:TRAP-type uncharacterized transport system substrate-binding protein
MFVIAMVVVAVIAVLVMPSGPLFPRSLRILAGPEGSTYHTDALAYAEFLERNGVHAEVVETNGSVENLELIAAADDDHTIALAETGLEALIDGFDADGLVSLGSVHPTPFWLFIRRDLEFSDESDLRGRLIVPGEPGSAVRAVVMIVLRENGLPLDILASPLSTIPAEEVPDLLEEGRADAAFVIGAPGSPGIDELLRSEVVVPVSLQRAEAYDRRYGRLGIVTLPRGAFDLALDIPAEDLTLIASAIQIVASEQLSPMLVDLVLDAASETHRDATLFTDRGEYPRADISSFPLAASAQRFYTEGPSPLRRYLPFWAATLLDRFALAAAAVLGVLFALLNVLPGLLALPFNMKLARVYRVLESVEKRTVTGADPEELLPELDDLVEEIHAMRVPRAQLPPYFEMRQNVFDLRERVRALSD